MNLIAFLSLPNSRVGEPRDGYVIGTVELQSVTPVLDVATDADITITSVAGTGGRAWKVTVAPTRTGVIWMTVQVADLVGQVQTERVAILSVAEGEEVPVAGSPRFRKLLPASVDVTGIASQANNGFWATMTCGAGTISLDAVEVPGTPAGTIAAKYSPQGVCELAVRINGGSVLAMASDGSNLYLAVSGATAALNGDGTVWATLISTTRYVLKVDADGVWQWATPIVGGLNWGMQLAATPDHAYVLIGSDAGPLDVDNGTFAESGATFVLVKLDVDDGSALSIVSSDGATFLGGVISGEIVAPGSLMVTPTGLPIATMTTTVNAVSAGSSPFGVEMDSNEQWVALWSTALVPINWQRLSSDRLNAEIQNARLDAGSSAIWYAVRVDGPALFGSAETEAAFPYASTEPAAEWHLLRTSMTLGSVEVTAKTDEAINAAQVLVLAPGTVAFAAKLTVSDVPSDSAAAIFLASEGTFENVGTAARGIAGEGGSIDNLLVAAARTYGGGIVEVQCEDSTSPLDLIFSPDPLASDPIEVPTGGRSVLATVDATGGWSSGEGVPLIGGSDPYPDVPGFDLGDLDPGIEGEGEPSTPGAPGPTNLGSIAEDGVLATRLHWADPDLPDETQDYTLEIAETAGGPWQTEALVLPDGFVTLATGAREGHDRFCGVVVVPEANWAGTLTFLARVRKSSYPADLLSAVSPVTLTVEGATDAPSQPSPSRMPTVEAGVVAQGIFTFVDPDGSSWTPTVSATRDGPYGSSVSLPGKGTITVVDDDNTDHTFDLRFDQVAGGYTGTYSVWVKVTDSTGLASVPLLVSGVVSSANIIVELQRVVRASASADPVFEALAPLTTLIDMSVTEALDGPGSATLVVAASELKRRAATLGISPASLVKAGSVEVKVSVNGTPIFTGPITGYRHDLTQEQVTIEATGLMGYLEARAIEGTNSTTFTGHEQSQIIWDLINAEQQKNYGKLGLTNGTVDTSRVIPSISFEPKSTVAAAIYELRDRLNGPEVWIDPDRVVRTAVRRSTDRRGQIVFTPQNTSRFETSTDWKVLANVVTVYGTGATSSASDEASLGTFGRMVRPLDAEQLTTPAACATVAANYLGDLKELPEAYFIVHDANPERPFGLLDYNVGDAVSIEAATLLGRITADVRIISRTIRLVQGTAASFDVELTLDRISSDGVIRSSRSDHNPELVSQLYDALYRS